MGKVVRHLRYLVVEAMGLRVVLELVVLWWI